MTECSDMIRVGSRVRLHDGDGEAVYNIVDASEADVASRRVSSESPLGRALVGRRPGDQVRYRAPAGVLAVTVLEVNG